MCSSSTAVIGPERRVLWIGALLYAAALVGCYLIPTAVGGNVDRLGALVAGPIAACVLAGSTPARRRALIVLAPFLLYWQANAPVADYISAASDPAVQASYYTPLLGELHTLGVGYSARPARIEVVPTRDHWEARYVAPRLPHRARLGAPARRLPGRAVLRAPPRSRARATAPGSPKRRSPTSRFPTRRSTTRALGGRAVAAAR